jgi:hypothetical protein
MGVWEDAYLHLEIDQERHLVRQVRSARVYADIAAFEQSVGEMVTQMVGLQRDEYVLLHDVRLSRGRNDPGFEAAIQRARPRMCGGFRRVAIMVATKIGQLQVQRLEQAGASPARVFLDEQEALRWLLQS